jgi:DNA primase
MRDEQLRDTIQARAVELIGQFVRLQAQGKHYVGRCPFHDDTHPSLSVSADKGVFHCFGCGVAGDSLAFVMRKSGCTFPEALDEATRRLGLPPPIRPTEATTTPLAMTAEYAARLFSQWLWLDTGASCRRYLQTRGITEATAKHFRLGYQPDHPTLLLRALSAHGVTMPQAAALGLATRRGERWISGFRGRLIFPITDGRGQVRGFGARALTDRGPKYLNSPDSPLFHKKQLLYGLAQAREALQSRGEAIMVEGYLDVLTLHQAGLTAAVSPLSTTLSTAQLTLLHPLVKQVVVLFDGDSAGQTAMSRIFQPAEESRIAVRVATLPLTHDPDSYVRAHGGDAFKALIVQAIPLDAHVLQQLGTQYAREQAGREVVVMAERMPDPVRQLLFLQQAEVQLQLPAESLSELLGIGETARQRLEELVSELVLVIPEVRTHLRDVMLPLRNPQLRKVVSRALQQGPLREEQHERHVCGTNAGEGY